MVIANAFTCKPKNFYSYGLHLNNYRLSLPLPFQISVTTVDMNACIYNSWISLMSDHAVITNTFTFYYFIFLFAQSTSGKQLQVWKSTNGVAMAFLYNLELLSVYWWHSQATLRVTASGKTGLIIHFTLQ